MLPRSVLIIQTGMWDDAMRSAFMPHVIKDADPQIKVDAILPDNLEEFGECLHFDEARLLSFDWFFGKWWQKLFSRLELFLFLIKKQYDVAIVLGHSEGFRWLLRLSGTRHIYSFCAPSQKEALINNIEKSRDESLIDGYIRVLKEVGFETQKLNFKIKISESAHKLTMKRLKIFDLPSKGFIAVGPGPGDMFPTHFVNKRWPFMQDFLKLFLQRTKLPVLLLGELQDTETILPLIETDHRRVHSWAGQAGHEEMAITVGEALAYVGCESGLSCVAGALGIPSVLLFGPGDWKHKAPPGANKNVIGIQGRVPCAPCYKIEGNYDFSCKDNICMKTISPEDVWNALVKIAPEIKGPA